MWPRAGWAANPAAGFISILDSPDILSSGGRGVREVSFLRIAIPRAAATRNRRDSSKHHWQQRKNSMSISCGARTATRAGLALILLLFCSCGGAHPLGVPPIPVPLSPVYGTVCNVLISDLISEPVVEVDYI